MLVRALPERQPHAHCGTKTTASRLTLRPDANATTAGIPPTPPTATIQNWRRRQPRTSTAPNLPIQYSTPSRRNRSTTPTLASRCSRWSFPNELTRVTSPCLHAATANNDPEGHLASSLDVSLHRVATQGLGLVHGQISIPQQGIQIILRAHLSNTDTDGE